MVLSFFPPLTNPITPLFDTVEGAECVEFAASSLDIEDEDEVILQRFSVVEFCCKLKEEDSWPADSAVAGVGLLRLSSSFLRLLLLLARKLF